MGTQGRPKPSQVSPGPAEIFGPTCFEIKRNDDKRSRGSEFANEIIGDETRTTERLLRKMSDSLPCQHAILSADSYARGSGVE